MKAVFALLSIVAVANAGFAGAPGSYLTRAPAFDSAVIQSDRLGGNFAYSVAENHAYAQHTPIVQHIPTPVAVSYSAPAIAHSGYASPLAYSAYNGYAAAAPLGYSGYAAHGYPGIYGFGK